MLLGELSGYRLVSIYPFAGTEPAGAVRVCLSRKVDNLTDWRCLVVVDGMHVVRDSGDRASLTAAWDATQ